MEKENSFLSETGKIAIPVALQESVWWENSLLYLMC